MDVQQLLDQLNDALNRWWQETVAYFSDLSRMEEYGWIAFGVGFLLFVLGFFLL